VYTFLIVLRLEVPKCTLSYSDFFIVLLLEVPKCTLPNAWLKNLKVTKCTLLSAWVEGDNVYTSYVWIGL